MLRSLCKVHRWWMSFLPYRSLSALMIPRHHRLPRGSVWRALTPVAPTLPAIPRRSRGSPSPLPRSPGGAFSLHGPRRARPRTPDRRGGPCLGTSRRAETLRDCAPGTASAASPSPRPDGGTPSSASHRKPCLPPSPSLRTCEQTFPEAPPTGVPPKSPRDS